MPEALTFAIPGKLGTLTGGYIYDARIIDELRKGGMKVTLLELGDGFPFPSAETKSKAIQLLVEAAQNGPVIVDGLALGVLPEAAASIALVGKLVALVHHPLALESGLSMKAAAALAECERAALIPAARVIVTSPSTAEILEAEFGVDKSRISVARPGVDPAKLSKGSGGTHLSLLSVAAISQRKGFDVLIAALQPLMALDWQLIIVGDDTRSPDVVEALRRQIASFGMTDRICLAGRMEADKLATLYASADIFVLASHFEGYGMAYAEALAHGLPVIGTTGGAIADLVPKTAGILVEPGDVEALSQALEQVMRDRQLRKSLSAGAGQAASSLPSWHEAAEIFRDVLESVA